MKVACKLFVTVLVVCAVAGMVFYQGCQKEEQTTPAKEAEPAAAVKEVKPAAAGEPAEKEETAVPPEQEEAAKPAEAGAPVMPAAKPAAPAEAELVDADEPAVTVNGNVITEGQVEARVKLVMDRRSSRLDPNMAAQYKRRVRDQMLEGMVLEQLLDAQMKKFNVEVNEADVNDKIGEIIDAQGISLDTFKQLVASQGQSYDQFVEQVRKSAGYEKLLEKQAGPIDINDAAAIAHYEQNKERFVEEEQVRASHILVKVLPSATVEERAQARQKAENLLEQVKEEGADFADVARENSDCPSKVEGGDLNFFPRGQMVREFEDVAFSLQPGQISAVVETQFGFHIIKVTDHKPGAVMTFEQVRDKIKKGLAKQEAQKMYRAFIEKLKAEAKIEYPPGKEPTPARREIIPRPAPAEPTPPPK